MASPRGRTDMAQRTCAVEGCPRPVRARGLCSTDYNRQHQPGRHRKAAVRCGWCDRLTDKEPDRSRGYSLRFCSLSCRDTWRQRDKLPVIYVGQILRNEPTLPTLQPRVWVAGSCRTCGQPFVDRQPDARSCSPLCTRRWWRKQYADEVPPSIRRHVLARDRWRCAICRRAIRRHLAVPHPRSATVDHVIPQSQGGTHDPANLRAAHMGCNSSRNNRGGNEQLALIG